MSKWLLTIFVFVVIMLFFTVVVKAHQCADREVMVAHLAKEYNAKPVAIGLDKTGYILEVFATPSGVWVMFRTSPNGITCLITNGDNWQNLSPKGKPTKMKIEREA